MDCRQYTLNAENALRMKDRVIRAKNFMLFFFFFHSLFKVDRDHIYNLQFYLPGDFFFCERLSGEIFFLNCIKNKSNKNVIVIDRLQTN